MLAQPIESLLRGAGATLLTDIFLFAIAIVFAGGLFLKYKNLKPSVTAYAPTLLTTIGILGTFAGIVSGLLGFEVENIDESIATLLDGLKTAFLTSIAGMFASLSYKVIVTSGVLTAKDVEQLEGSVDAGDLLIALRDQRETLLSLVDAVGGDRESSLVGQIKLMRSDASDANKLAREELKTISAGITKIEETVSSQKSEFEEFQNRLWIKLQDFADMLSKSATEQVINALKEVISDFNNNLVEQFGDNFKQLNNAVLELVKWQDNYKAQLEEMIKQYQSGLDSISSTEQAVKVISQESKAIPESMNDLKAVMEVNQHQLSELERHLEVFNTIRDRAVEALPSIQETIDASVEGMRTATQIINEGLAKTTDTLTKGLESATETVSKGLADSVSASISNVEQATDILTSGVKDASESLVSGVRESSDNIYKSMNESSDSLKTAIIQGSEEFITGSQRVNESLTSTSDLLKESSEQTRSMFNDMLSDINNDIRDLVEKLKQGNESISSEYKQAAQNLVQGFVEIEQKFATDLKQLTSSVSSEIKTLAEDQAREARTVLQAMSQTADQALQDTNEAVTKQVRALDEATAQQVSTVMNNMGQALAKITGQFSTDYQRLVEAMDKLARSGGGR